MKKWIFISFFLILAGGSLKVYSQEALLEWIPFQWQGDTISGKYIEKAYLYVPVKIDDLPIDFTMQFDLGTIETQFYENPIKPYLEEYPSLANKLGSMGSLKNVIFKDVNLHMGTVDFSFDVWLRADFGEDIPRDSLHSGTPKHIGTIAPDMFRDKVLVIDYKSSQFAISDSLPAEYQDLQAVKFELNNGIIILPFRINGAEQKLMFDTGSSPFPLAASKKRALEIADPSIVDSLSGPLWWGREITFYGHEVNKSIEFGGTTLGNAIVYYDKDGLWEEGVFKPLKIWGLTGNVYFLNCVIILDYKNKLFRINRN
ncbi:MAG: hypothetical protein LBL90_10065 [Prevotellaceae bacterium]|jgi:hypothetical protein|nr:hypothetical protein [Prevotellaceae bacterium]